MQKSRKVYKEKSKYYTWKVQYLKGKALHAQHKQDKCLNQNINKNVGSTYSDNDKSK